MSKWFYVFKKPSRALKPIKKMLKFLDKTAFRQKYVSFYIEYLDFGWRNESIG